MPLRFLLLAFIVLALPAFAAPQYNWEKLEGCTLVDSRWNDGDSFHARHDGKNYIFRLYFVDTPENETRFPARIAEQAAYFGCSSERAMEIGKEASDFTTKVLGSKPFTIYTLWRDALGASSKPRFYAVIETDKGNLAELLVKNGLARIYGKRVQLPDGTDSRSYLEKLVALREKAMEAHKGGWAELAVAR